MMDKSERKKRLENLLQVQTQKQSEEEEKRQIEIVMGPFSNKDNIEVLLKEEWSIMEEELIRNFPITPWKRIDWDEMDKKIMLKSEDYREIEKLLRENNLFNTKPVYFFFSDGGTPWLKTNLLKIFENIEDISFYTGDRYVYCQSPKFIIEFFHDDIITIGWR
jgi:hypothetical protein